MAKKSNRTKPALKEEEPPAPWGSFPLVELSVLAGLILIVIGAITTNPVQLGIGLALGSLGGLELSIREHFAGYRSHTTLLAGVAFVVTTGLMRPYIQASLIRSGTSFADPLRDKLR